MSIKVFQATANAAAPSYAEGQRVFLSADLSGNLRTILAAGSAVIGTVAQGNAGSNAQAWWIRIGDATNGPVAVKAASTAAIATDPSLVTAFSPNSPLPTGSNVIGGVTQSGTWTVQQGTPPWTQRIQDGVGATLATVTAGNALKVDGSGVTQPISAVSLPLPTGAATETTLGTRLADATFTGRINTQGQKAMAVSTPVVIASDQSAVPVSGTVTANQGTAAAGTAGWPVVGGNVARATATWTSATALDTVLAVSITGYSSVLVTLNQGTTITAGGVIFEGSDDGVNWYRVLGASSRLGSADIVGSGYVFVANLNETWRFSTAGFSNFRVHLNIVIVGTGSVVVGINPQAMAMTPVVALVGSCVVGSGVPSDAIYIAGRRGDTGAAQFFNLDGNGNLTIVGFFTDNSSNSSQKTPTLPARANAAAPSWTEGNQVPLSTDLAGSLRIIGVISSKTALTASSPTAATVGVASAQAVASNANRKGLVLVNTSVNTISIAFGATAVLNSGITLQPGGTFEMDEWIFSTAAINAIASAASSNLAIQEFTT
mgnify:CR=1 FL=1